jgi:hypothetical protein
MSRCKFEVRAPKEIFVVEVIGFDPVVLRFSVLPNDGGSRQEVDLPLRAIMETWPLITAALTLRGIAL